MKKFFTSILSATIATISLTAVAAVENGTVYSLSQGNKAVFIANASPNGGTAAVIWTQTDVPAQRWVAEVQSDGTVAFRNLYSGLYLGYGGTKENAAMTQSTFSRMRGLWNVKESESAPGKYQLIPTMAKTLCAGVPAETDGTKLALANPETSTSNMLFELVADPDAPSSFNEDVRDAIIDGFVGQYYHKASTGYVLGGGGWWGDAEMFETILDAFITTGDIRYKEMFDELYIDFTRRNGTDWSGNQYNDDITWMVLATARAYRYFGKTTYKTVATDNYKRMYNRALQKYGTLIWKQDQDNKLGTNSCINCPATIAACYIAEINDDPTWYDKAVKLYAAQRSILYNPDNGEVFDSGFWTTTGGTDVTNRWVSTYNQGTMLGAAVALYLHTGDEAYLTDAHKIYARSKGLANSNGIVSVCQTINGDLCGFKGILMRYMRTYAQALGLDEPFEWVAKNAWHAYQNRTSGGVIWSAWLTKTDESLKRYEGEDLKDITNDAFGSSTAVSAAANAFINRKAVKKASDVIEASWFDDLKYTWLDKEATDGVTPNTAPSALTGATICFRGVDFGTGSSNSVTLRLKANSGRSYARVYADAVDDAHLLGRNSGFVVKSSWNDVPVSWGDDKTLTGVHDIYVEFVGTGLQMHNMKFNVEDSGIADATADSKAVSFSTNASNLVVNATEGGHLLVVNPAGQTVAELNISEGMTSVPLYAGFFICSFTNGKIRTTDKVMIK